jgi:branched-chain amino acid aminotransferase
MSIYYVNGEYVSEEDARISVGDLGILRGYGIFDFLRTYHGVPFRLDDHLARLERSASLIELPLPWAREELAAIIRETLDRNTHPESYIRIVVTGGQSADGITPAEAPSLIVLVTPAPTDDPKLFEDGVKLITMRTDRTLPTAKTINYIPAVLALKKAKAAGAFEALYVNAKGIALECTRSNLFIVCDGTLITPEIGILHGITRKVTLERAAGICEVELRALTLDEVQSADEVFITSSTKEVLPVVQIDDAIIGDGKPGTLTLQLRESFLAYAEAVSRS